MSTPHHLLQRHLNLLPSSTHKTSQFFVRPHIADRLYQLLDEIEAFLWTCSYEEICNFWNAISNLRQCIQKRHNQPQVPQFLTCRRKQRDFCRILEVLADLPYPKLHLSHHPVRHSGDRAKSQQLKPPQSAFAHPHFAHPHFTKQK